MAKKKTPRTADVRTTTISVTKPIDFTRLQSEFKLVRYIIPDRLRSNTNWKIFERIHAQLKEQLDHPYKSYQYDELDGPERWAVYVLYPRVIEPLAIKVDDAALEMREIDFDVPEFHLLLKLLQIQYFRGDAQGKFLGRDSCYVYARRDGKKAHVCMQIDLIGDIANEDSQQTQLFKVTGSAQKFIPPRRVVEQGKQYANPYYAISRFDEQGTPLFQQVKPNQVIGLSKSGQIYEQRSFEGKRTTLEYHSLDDVERSRGYLIDTFIAGFSDFLGIYGFDVQPVQRRFTQFTPPREITEFKLPLELLDVVSIYDVRMRDSISIEQYKALFEEQFPEVTFKIITQLTKEFDGVVLFIMDFAPEAFEADKPLYGQKDPYKELYERYPSIPKQGLNVNLNDLGQAENHGDQAAWYLNYRMLDADDKNIRNRIIVAMNELFLKHVVMRECSVTERLPYGYPPYIFVRRVTQNKTPYEVALYFENDMAQFLDLRSPIDRNIFHKHLATFNVDWEENYRALLARYRKSEDDKLTRYDLIIGHGLFVEIAELNERVLYEFDEIKERQQKKQDLFPISDFKLTHWYDDLRLGNMLPLGELLRQGLIDSEGNILHSGETKKQAQSLEFLAQLQRYDNVLDEMELQYPEISFNDLCENEYWLPRIAQAFGRRPNSQGKYESGFLKRLYGRMDELFPTDRESTLTPTYQGIWMDDDYRFIVGDVNSLKLTGQAKAHLVRQFISYQSSDTLDVTSLLNGTSVRFVRLNQYTVYPYFYHLIDLYIENVLQYVIVE